MKLSIGKRADKEERIGKRSQPSSQVVPVRQGRPPALAASLLQLQRTHGNQFVQMMLVQAQRADGETEVVPEVENAIQGAHGRGQALDKAMRTNMETAFGADFSHVRVHTDVEADQLNQTLNARAFTTGQDIFFRDGEYNPGDVRGRRLLAHELTHVVQQTGGVQFKRILGQAGDQYEREADRVAEAVMPMLERQASDAAVVPGHIQPTRLQRLCSECEEGQEIALQAKEIPGHAPQGVGRTADHIATRRPVAEAQHNEPDRHHVCPQMVQRTPAPPAYGGVTGTRDLTKIRVDAVPDFVPSIFVPVRVVNVHVSDPAVKHISWELYDPSDQLMPGSYSTLPGHPSSITRPFLLMHSHFSGAGFVAGKYLLRCVGRNASHQPVIYADRDFNVLTSDLTTGTALPTTYGDLTFTKYDKTDASPPANPNYSIDVELQFLPKTTVVCNDVGFMQSMQTIDHQGRSQQNTVNVEQDARQTPLAWSIDRVAGAPSPFYITGRDPVTGSIVDVPGWGRAGSGGAMPSEATLIDQPSWNQENYAKFESCVICRSGANRGQVYGCATWGYTANAAGKVTLTPRGFRQMPSDQFTEARDAWNTWRTSVPAATRPEEAPNLTSP